MILTTINNNYPNAFYGNFIMKNSGGYVLFLRGEYIDDVPNFEVHFNIPPQQMDNFKKWGIVSTDKGIHLVSLTTKNTLIPLFEHDVQWIDVTCYNDYDNTILGTYYLLNLIHHEIKEEYKITREEEYGLIYTSKEVKSYLKRNKIRGFSYITDE